MQLLLTGKAKIIIAINTMDGKVSLTYIDVLIVVNNYGIKLFFI